MLRNLWTARVTSHVAQPRLAVCGLNPHNGDGGDSGAICADQFAQMNRQKFDRFGSLIKQAGIKPE